MTNTYDTTYDRNSKRALDTQTYNVLMRVSSLSAVDYP